MNFIRRLRAWIHRPTMERYQELILRIGNLETIIECLLESPAVPDNDSIGFNSQQRRKEILDALHENARFDVCIETGTWIGNTTAYLARKLRIPVYSCELDKRLYALAKQRLRDIPNVTLEQSNSVAFLQKFAKEDSLTSKRVFFYLDAHWYASVPLEEEIQIITKYWKTFVIMVDDFEVPGDRGYGFDDFYGEKLSLYHRNFAPIFAGLGLRMFFPKASSGEETGSRRGCVILVPGGDLEAMAMRLPELRKA